jgi:NAD(P)-dependent dehydrogenase (short-subunit alcohol dehydrogenase family)
MSARRAVVTGAGRGIGAVIAQRLEEDGYEVARLDIAATASFVATSRTRTTCVPRPTRSAPSTCS